MKVTGNVKYIPAGTTQYIVDGNDGQINVDTSVSSVTIVLPNIINSGYANTDKGFIINDISNNAATNNITIVASNNTTNSQSSVLISVNGGTAKCSIASLNEWFVITEPTTSGMSGNLTANYIPKAVTSSTLGNSVIYQNGSNIGINTTNPLTKLTVSANDQSALISSVRYETVGSSPAGIVSLRARGTDLLPTALANGDEIATFAAVGYYGAGFGTTGDANFIFYAAENFTLTNRGTSCKVGTTPLGTSSVIYNFGINSEGNVSIGIPSLNPTARLHVTGVSATSSDFAFKADNLSTSPLLYVRNDAKVGIKNSNPAFTLDVSGVTAAGDGIIVARSTGSQYLAGIQNDLASGGYLALYDGATGTKVILNSSTYSAFDKINTGMSLSVGNLGSALAKFQVKGDVASASANIFLFQSEGGGNIIYGRNDGYIIKAVPNSALSDASLSASQMTSYINEGTNELIFKVKYSDGTTVKTGSIALV